MAKITLAAIRDFEGLDLGISDWATIDQSMTDQFAACTGDRHWIHVDAGRARKESLAGGTIARGFLSLSLIAPLGMALGLAPVDASAGSNYGPDKVRFSEVRDTGEVRQSRSPATVDGERRTERWRALPHQKERGTRD